MVDTGIFSLIVFTLGILLILIYHAWKYFALKQKGNFFAAAGSFGIILGIIISQGNTSLGIIIMNIGGGLMMIGYFFLLFISEKKRESTNKTGLFYHPKFMMFAEIVAGLLSIALGIYNIISHGAFSDNLDTVVYIFFGVGLIIYAIVSYRKRR